MCAQQAAASMYVRTYALLFLLQKLGRKKKKKSFKNQEMIDRCCHSHSHMREVRSIDRVLAPIQTSNGHQHVKGVITSSLTEIQWAMHGHEETRRIRCTHSS